MYRQGLHDLDSIPEQFKGIKISTPLKFKDTFTKALQEKYLGSSQFKQKPCVHFIRPTGIQVFFDKPVYDEIKRRYIRKRTFSSPIPFEYLEVV